MGWFQAVAGDSITRSYLQFVSIKRDGPECLQRELYAVCGACLLKISLLSEETTNVIPGWGLLAVCSCWSECAAHSSLHPRLLHFKVKGQEFPQIYWSVLQETAELVAPVTESTFLPPLRSSV